MTQGALKRADEENQMLERMVLDRQADGLLIPEIAAVLHLPKEQIEEIITAWLWRK